MALSCSASAFLVAAVFEAMASNNAASSSAAVSFLEVFLPLDGFALEAEDQAPPAPTDVEVPSS